MTLTYEPNERVAVRASEYESLLRDAKRWRWLRQIKSLETDRLKPSEWDEMADAGIAYVGGKPNRKVK